MSAYPECKHGHNHPMHRCEQCDLENELDRLREENQQLRAKLAIIPRLRSTLYSDAKAIESLCSMVSNYAQKLGLGRKVRADDWTEKTLNSIALIDSQQP